MADTHEEISEREMEVLELLPSGASNKEIAEQLGISQNTVKVHLRNIYSKLVVNSRAQASMKALELGLITLPGQPSVADSEPAAVESAEDLGPPSSVLESPIIPSDDNQDRLDPPIVPEAESRPIEVETVGADSESVTAAVAPRRIPIWAWGIGGLIIALLLVIVGQLLNPPTPAIEQTPTIEPFIEVEISESRWFITRALPEPRADAVLVPFGVSLYQIGGLAADTAVTGQVDVFDTDQLVWRTAASKPTPVADAAAAELFDLIYVVGGIDGDGSLSDRVEAYSPVDDEWFTAAPLPEPLSGAVALSDGGLLYVMGGQTEEGITDKSFVYDPQDDAWRPLPALPNPVADAAGGSVANRLYIIGGLDSAAELTNQCTYFDVVTTEWGSCPPLSAPRADAGAVTVVNEIYLLGGDTEVDYGELYDPEGSGWQIIPIPPEVLPAESAWSGVSVANIQARVYTVGGFRDGAMTADVYVYSPLAFKAFLPSALSAGDEE